MMGRIVLLLSLMACQGPEGPAGADGTDGGDGADGVDGVDGVDGTYHTIIDADTTWSEDVLVSSDTWVQSGATLTIEPGVTVTFAPGMSLVVAGALVVAGTAEETVQLNGVPAFEDPVSALRLVGDPGLTTLDHFSANRLGIFVYGDGTVSLSNCEMMDSDLQIRDRTTEFTIDGCTIAPGIEMVNAAIDARGLPALTVNNSTIRDATTGVSFLGYQDGATLSVSNTSIQNTRNGIYSYSIVPDQTLKAVLNGVTLLETNSRPIYLTGTSLDAAGLDIPSAGAQAILTNRDVKLANSTISNAANECINASGLYPVEVTTSVLDGCESSGIYASGDITVSDTSITNVRNGLYSINGSITATSTSVVDTGYYGAYVGSADGTLTLSNSTVDNTAYHCVYSRGALIVSDTVVSNCTGWGLYATYSMDLDTVDLSNTTSYGIGVYYEDLTIKDVSLSSISRTGMYLYNGNLTAEGLTLKDIGGDGMYVKGNASLKNLSVDNTSGDGIDVRGATVLLEDSVIQNTGAYGAYMRYSAVEMINSSILNSSSYGLRVASLNMSYSDVVGGTTGIYIETDADSTIDYSVISDNSSNGIYGKNKTGMKLDISNCNIMRNGGYGARHVRTMAGNYVADNRGLTAVDDTEDGTTDGTYDSSSSQIYLADAILNPQDAEVSGAGAP